MVIKHLSFLTSRGGQIQDHTSWLPGITECLNSEYPRKMLFAFWFFFHQEIMGGHSTGRDLTYGKFIERDF